MASLKIVGEYIGARPEKKINDTLTVQEFAIETNEQFYATKVFQAKNERRDVLSAFKKGDMVEVSFNIRCIRTESGAWFTTLEAWRVQAHIAQSTDDFTAVGVKETTALQPVAFVEDDLSAKHDDLPF